MLYEDAGGLFVATAVSVVCVILVFAVVLFTEAAAAALLLCFEVNKFLKKVRIDENGPGLGVVCTTGVVTASPVPVCEPWTVCSVVFVSCVTETAVVSLVGSVVTTVCVDENVSFCSSMRKICYFVTFEL